MSSDSGNILLLHFQDDSDSEDEEDVVVGVIDSDSEDVSGQQCDDDSQTDES